jgi:hypothetical protein
MNICVDCVGNDYYKKYIKDNGKRRKCGYCPNKNKKCIDLELLANEVDESYRADYEPTEEYGDCPSYVISEMLGLDNEVIADNLVNILSERENRDVNQGADAFYDADRLYVAQPNLGNFGYHRETWEWFCSTIKHQTRFFNQKFLNDLNGLFKELDRFKCGNISPVREISPDDADALFYRARRAANSKEEAEILNNPNGELAAPPPNKSNSGRMNPKGISVFYGAYEIKTCIAELRLLVGEKAICGQFKFKKLITILDLTLLKEIDEPRYYAGDDIDNLAGLFYFLRDFASEISKPVHPNDADLEYLPTQAFSEYLNNHYKRRIDAIIYSSSQTKYNEGKNIVILGRAAEIRGDEDDYLSFVSDSIKTYRVTGIDYHIDDANFSMQEAFEFQY